VNLLVSRSATAPMGAVIAAALALGIALTGARATSPSIVVTYDVEYEGLFSFDVGRATVQYSATSTGYQLALSFRPSPSAHSFALGPALARTSGAVSPQGLSPASAMLDYSVRSLTETRNFTFAADKLQSVRIVKRKSGGLFKDSSAVAYDPRSIPAFAPLSESDQKGVLDPLSAIFLPVAGTNGLDRSNCERKLRIYDGRRRFDLVMSYRGREKTGLAGEALTCTATYVPIAGQSVEGDDFTTKMRDYRIGVALVTAPGSNFLIPARITLTDGSGASVAEAKAIALSGR
jgi:hypothetical protein